MLSISLGPIALPVAPLVLLVAVWLAGWVARRVALRTLPAQDAERAESAVWTAALIGLLAARAGHLAQHAAAYASEPWAVFDIRDGGWSPLAGLAGAGVWLAARAGARPALRRAFGAAALVGGGGWLLGQGTIIVTGTASQGAAAPAVALAPLDGGPTRPLPEVIAGKPAVVNLWASWCGPCRVEMPTLAAAQQRHPEVRFVFVNQGESAQAVHAYLTGERLALHEVWLDRGVALGSAVGSAGLPTTLFFDAEGRRVGAHFGVLNAAALQVRLQEFGVR